MKYACFLLIFLGVPRIQAQSGGVSTEWDLRQLLDALATQTQHLKSVIGQVKTEEMIANGAPSTYITQWSSAQTDLKYLLGSVETLAKQPERMPFALDSLFRMQSMETTLGSVFEGMRKYQNPALADLLQAVVNENSANRDRLKQYVRDLAVQKEQEYQVADKEAQRCRGALLHEAAPREKRK